MLFGERMRGPLLLCSRLELLNTWSLWPDINSPSWLCNSLSSRCVVPLRRCVRLDAETTAQDGKTQIVSSKNISLQLSNLSATLRVLEATTPALDEVYLTTPTDIETLPLRFSASLGMAHVSSIPSTSMEALSVGMCFFAR